MRLLLRAGILLALAAAACKEAVTPVDFKDPVALSANLSSVDSAVNTQVARSFSTATLNLNAATAPAIGPVAALLATVSPQLQRSGARMFLPGLVQARSMQAQLPNLSVAAAHDDFARRGMDRDDVHRLVESAGQPLPLADRVARETTVLTDDIATRCNECARREGRCIGGKMLLEDRHVIVVGDETDLDRFFLVCGH